jgi:peptide/nickel transport system permease protein
MARYIVIRLVQAIVTIWAVLSLTFVLAHMAGDPSALLLPPESSPAAIAAYRHAIGLDRPLGVQYLTFLGDASHFDFGNSLRGGGPALDFVTARLPATLELAGVSLAVSLVLALGLGLTIELTSSKRLRTFILSLALIREAVPVFVFGLLLIIVFGVKLQWFPFIGKAGPDSFVLPVATLSSVTLALYLRVLRSSFAQERSQDYVRTALAKGASRSHIVLREAFPNVLLPFVTTVAVNAGFLIVGSVLVETVFSWPGMAYAMVQAVEQRDFPVIQAGVILIAIVFIAVNTIADIVCSRLDPRIALA